MKIEGFNQLLSNTIQNNPVNKAGGKEFSEVLTDLVKSVQVNQKEANTLTEDFVNGGDVEIHDVMIAAEKAKTSLELLMEIRNKSIDMYKELTRMSG